MRTVRLALLASFALMASSFVAPAAFAQGVFMGSGEVSDPNCVGDGCGFVPQETVSESVESVAEQEDSADSTVDVSEFDEDDTPHYVNENAAEYRARKEGFSKQVQFGVRIGGGVNKHFGKKSEDWNLGFEVGAGLMARLPIARNFSASTELDFSYRHYGYEAKSDYGRSEATVTEMLFEIPVMGQYFFDDDGFYIGFGINIGLKMQGESEFKQIIDAQDFAGKEKRSNTLPTAGVECGGLMEIGYAVNRWFTVDLRVVQNFTNTLDADLVAESTLMHSKLYTMHGGLGATFLF